MKLFLSVLLCVGIGLITSVIGWIVSVFWLSPAGARRAFDRQAGGPSIKPGAIQ